jgi:hypothetical protein
MEIDREVSRKVPGNIRKVPETPDFFELYQSCIDEGIMPMT